MVGGGHRPKVVTRNHADMTAVRCPHCDHRGEPEEFFATDSSWGIGMIVCPGCDAILGAYGPER